MANGHSLPRPAHRWIFFIFWSLIAVAYLVYFLADLRQDFVQLQDACSGLNCNYLAISSTEMAMLESWGGTGRLYALMMVSASGLAAIIYWSLSGLILWRIGLTRIGWTVSLTLFVIPASIIADVDNVIAAFPQWRIPSLFLAAAGIGVVFLFFYLTPNGRFYPRWAAVPMTLTILVGSAYYFQLQGVINPAPQFDWIVSETLMFSLIALAPIFQFLRYHRRSLPIERQQTKWLFVGFFPITLAFALAFALFLGGLTIQPGAPRLFANLIGWILFQIFICALPVSITISILRYRLWDVDLIIRRTLQYGLLTGILALLYFSGVVLLQSGAASLLGKADSPLLVVLTTLGIAALFNPLRLRVQTFIDQRFYRARYNSERTLEAFATAARDEVDLDRLTQALLNAVENTVQPIRINLLIKGIPDK